MDLFHALLVCIFAKHKSPILGGVKSLLGSSARVALLELGLGAGDLQRFGCSGSALMSGVHGVCIMTLYTVLYLLSRDRVLGPSMTFCPIP